jgi:hypothetical protein
LKIPITKRWGGGAGRVTQGKSPEFKPQYCKKKERERERDRKGERGGEGRRGRQM